MVWLQGFGLQCTRTIKCRISYLDRRRSFHHWFHLLIGFILSRGNLFMAGNKEVYYSNMHESELRILSDDFRGRNHVKKRYTFQILLHSLLAIQTQNWLYFLSAMKESMPYYFHLIGNLIKNPISEINFFDALWNQIAFCKMCISLHKTDVFLVSSVQSVTFITWTSSKFLISLQAKQHWPFVFKRYHLRVVFSRFPLHRYKCGL